MNEAPRHRSSRRTFYVFGIASLAAVGAGCAIMSLSGVAPGSWIRNLVAWAVGGALAAGLLAYGRSRSASLAVLALTTIGLAATLLVPGQQGVHRWLDIGPLHINVAALLLPAGIVALAAVGIWSVAGLAAAAAMAALLVLQPDASQMTALAAAAAVLFLHAPASRGRGLLASAGAALLAGIAWTRPDPLEPVAQVEQIFSLGFALSPLLAVVAGLALAAASLAPVAVRAGVSAREAGLALAAYFAVAALAPLFGWYPVPLVGLGMSFIVGYWLALGFLCAPARGRRQAN